MNHGQFEGILDAQIKRVRDILVVKTKEYATDDQLHNLRHAALLKGESIPEAAIGMMVKHTVSIFTMVKSGRPYPEEVWDEKITDHIVWLILLKAALIEGAQNPLIPGVISSRNTFVANFLRTLAEADQVERPDTSNVLREAADILEQTTPNPNQGTLSC